MLAVNVRGSGRKEQWRRKQRSGGTHQHRGARLAHEPFARSAYLQTLATLQANKNVAQVGPSVQNDHVGD